MLVVRSLGGAKCALSSASAGPVAGWVGDDERRVDGDQAVTLGVRCEPLGDLVVAADPRHVDQPAVAVEDREPGGLAVPPGEVDADEVHGGSLPYGLPRWRLAHRSVRGESRSVPPLQRLLEASKSRRTKGTVSASEALRVPLWSLG